MGALVTRALRPIRSFNIENRAHREISKEKPTPAPKYPQNLEDMKRAMEADPDLDDKLDKKDSGLDDRLKDVYVISHGKPEDDITKNKQVKNPNRPLPEDRKIVEDFEYGFKEPSRINYGRTTLRHAINFITAHQTNPDEMSVAKISEEYKLKEDDVNDILKYFKTFEVYLPETKKTPAIFAGPSTLRKKLEASPDYKLLDDKSRQSLEKDEIQKLEEKIGKAAEAHKSR